MTKKLSALAVAVTLFTGAYAQDQLLKKDKTKLLVKIIEINTDEVKYKLYNNINGPTYTENKSDISQIIYESGQQETFNIAQAPRQAQSQASNIDGLSPADSAIYYKYSQSLAINFLNFFNNEVGFVYQAEFYKSNFNIIIPFAFGVEKPDITQGTYFGRNGNYFSLDKKNFEVGFGINYYPNLKTNVNYYIGPVFRFMQYSGSNSLMYSVPTNTYPYYNTYYTVTNHTNLNRYCMSITNGIMIRTRSRLNANLFGSVGFKNDVTDDKIVNPSTGVAVSTVRSPISFYFWCGLNVGFCF